MVTSIVKGVEIIFDATKLGEILHSMGITDYCWVSDEHSGLPSMFSQGRVTSRVQTVLKGVMGPVHKLLFKIVHKGILPRGHYRHIASLRDIGLMNALECKDHIDLLIIKHLARIFDPQLGSHQLAFDNLLTRVFTVFEVALGEGWALTRADMFTQSILADCGIPIEPEQVSNASPCPFGPVSQLLRELKVVEDKTATLELEN